MRILLIAMMAVLPAMSAVAIPQQRKDPPTTRRDEIAQQKKAIEEEKAYKSTIERIPVQKPADPWGKVR